MRRDFAGHFTTRVGERETKIIDERRNLEEMQNASVGLLTDLSIFQVIQVSPINDAI